MMMQFVETIKQEINVDGQPYWAYRVKDQYCARVCDDDNTHILFQSRADLLSWIDAGARVKNGRRELVMAYENGVRVA